MKAPPIILEPEDSPLQDSERNPYGWFALVGMFLLVLWSALSGSINPQGSEKYLSVDSELKAIVRADQMSRTSGAGGLVTLDLDEDTPAGQLRDLQQQLAPDIGRDNLATALYAAVLTELHKPVAYKDLGRLRRARLDSTRALAAIYSAPKLTMAQANALSKRLPKDGPFVLQLARVHAFEKAGDKTARSRLLPPLETWKMVVAGLVLMGVIGGCMLSWLVYSVSRANGYLQPLGLRNGAITGADADRLATRAAQLFGGFLVITTVVPMFFGKAVDSPWAMLFECLLMVLFVIGVSRTLVMGKRLSLADIGISSERLGEHIVWGLAGFAAELPLAIVFGLLVGKLLKFLPPPEHPASIELQTNHDLMTIISVLVFGAIVAPFWEEIMFRGLLFPGLSRLTKSVIVGGLTSSIVFASIHPQGVTLWLALATTGAMSCALSYQTRSLVPSIIMHAAHNATLLILTILLT